MLQPRFAGTESVLLAAGILGATVMPHVIYLHSALTQNRIVGRTAALKRRIFRYELVDILIAMGIAGLVNVSMLMMAAATFWETRDRGQRGDRHHPAGVSDPDAAAGRGGQHHLRRLAARLGPLVLGGRHHGRAGDHAGVHPPADPDLAAPPGHHDARR